MGPPFQLAVSRAEMNFNSFTTGLPLGETTISLRPRQVPGQAGAGLQPGLKLFVNIISVIHP